MTSARGTLCAGGLMTLAVLAVASSAGAATIEVTTISDIVANDGECALREAITATNSNADVNGADDCNHDGETDPDVIELGAGTHSTLGAAGEDANASGDLDVEAGAKLTIHGMGSGQTHIDGDLDRVVHLESGKLTLTRLELTDGEAGTGAGGGVLADGPGKLSLLRAKVSLSSAEEGGGLALADDGVSLKLTRATIEQNLADGPDVFDGGGGISFDGASAKIDRSTLSGNSTVNGDGGGLLVSDQEGSFEMSRSLIVDNHADARAAGGLSYDLFEGKMTLSRSLVAQNSARFGGGGVDVGNDANILVVKSSAISNNTLSSSANEIISGAGIHNGGVTRLRGSIVAGNTTDSPNGMATPYGVGIGNANGLEMTISNSLITGNHPVSGNSFGGGVYSAQPLEVTNTTLSANSAGTGPGGGLYAAFDPVVLSHVTFAGNTAGGDGDAIDINSTEATLHASIVANGADACAEPVTSTGFNLDEVASCGLGAQGDLPKTPAKVKPLADNGGPPIGPPGLSSSTLTHALRKSSDAVNHVPKAQCEDAAGRRLKTDQRGFSRPGGRRCDVGAFERGR